MKHCMLLLAVYVLCWAVTWRALLLLLLLLAPVLRHSIAGTDHLGSCSSGYVVLML